jgi:glucosamine--fructose-6-phosphate aminotransferase (isomerizing)
LYVIGKGEGLPIAREGALKIKEITYIHTETFSAGELKHGPIALIEPERNKTKIILIIMDDE